MAFIAPRIVCKDGVSLSVQAGEYHYCTPRDNSGTYSAKEVGFIRDASGDDMSPPDTWRDYADGDFPASVYGYVPVALIDAFIAEHGGAA